MKETQAEIVARIALDIDKEFTTKCILNALNRAYQSGWSAGFEVANHQHQAVQDLVYSALPR